MSNKWINKAVMAMWLFTGILLITFNIINEYKKKNTIDLKPLQKKNCLHQIACVCSTSPCYAPLDTNKQSTFDIKHHTLINHNCIASLITK